MKKAAKGQRLSLKNKYLSLLILLFSFGAQAQNIVYTPMTAGGYQFKYFKSDSGHAVPFRNLSTGRGTTRPGSIVCNTADSLLYYWNGVIWVQLGGTGGGGGTFFGIDSITYNNNFICQWKAGTSKCYSIIPGVDSVTLHDSTLCQWKDSVPTCYIIHGNVLGTFLDSVKVIGNQLCQYKDNVATCYTINNTSTGIDSVTVQDSLMCTYSQGVSTCFIIWTRDTIELADDLISRGRNSKGWQIIGRQHDDGFEANTGIVTSAGCLSLQVTTISFYHHGIHYTIPTTILTVPTPDATLSRIDAIIVDTLGNVKIRAGTPSISPVAPSFNPASELLLTTYPVPGGATCLNINNIVIYDETGGSEYDTSHTGVMSENFVNTDNPKHLTKALYIRSYADSSQIKFTKSSGTDTVFNNSVFAGFIYLNNPFNNQLQMQLFNGSTSVSNNIVVNNWFNTFDTLRYQPMDIPAYAFNAAGKIIYNKIVFTLRGNDLSGASGLYIDYLRLQTGLTNPQVDNSNKVDSVTIVSGSDYYWIRGVAHLVGVRATNKNDSTTASNGITLVGKDVQLGGALTGNTTITGGSRSLTYTGGTGTNTVNSFALSSAGLNETITDSTSIAFSRILHSKTAFSLFIRGSNNTDVGTFSLGPTTWSGAATDGTNVGGQILIKAKYIGTGTLNNGHGVPIYITATDPGLASDSLLNVFSSLDQGIKLYAKPKTASFAHARLVYVNGKGNVQTFSDSSGYIPLRVNGNAADSLGNITISTGGGGTVTNIATGYGLSGGTITSTGTIIVDSAALSLKYVRIVDTSAMLLPYAKGLVSVTKAQADVLIAGSTLIPGTFYKISGVHPTLYNDGTNPGTTIILQAIQTNKFASEGKGIFYNPKYTTAAGFGVWTSSIAHTVGAKAIYGGYSWTNVNGNIGAKTNITTLNSEWSKDVYSLTNYDIAIDAISYDYANDWITKRYEADADNEVIFTKGDSHNFSFTNSAISVFMFGNPLDVTGNFGVGSNHVINSYYETVDFAGSSASFNTLTEESGVYSNTFSNGSAFYNNKLLGQSSLYSNTVTLSTVYNNTLDNQSAIYSNTLTHYGEIANNTVNDISLIYSNTLDSSFIYKNTLLDGSFIYSNTADSGTSIHDIRLNGVSSVHDNALSKVAGIYACSLNNGSVISIGLGFPLKTKTINFLTGESGTISGSVSSATLLYTAYPKTLYKRPDGTSKLRYYNNSDILVISNITD